MRVRLRWKIMTFTVLPLVTLVVTTLWIVNRSITRQVQQGIQDDLRRASAVLDDLLAERAQWLVMAGQMTVQDPKFFSVLTLPGSYRDPQLRATVSGVARDFNALARADLFEVTDGGGHLIAAVGRDASAASRLEELVREALAGRPVSGILVEGDAHYQVSVTAVFAGSRVVGALLLGARIGGELAERLRHLTRSEVTFLSQGAVTASTLESSQDRDAVLAAVAELGHVSPDESRNGMLREVRGAAHRYLTLARALPQSDPRQMQFYVMQRAVDAETAFLRETQAAMVGLGIAAVFAALLAGLVIAERITAPVRRLVRAAEEMERSNYDFPLAVRSRDEIGDLAMRFEDMRRRQRDHVRGLQEVTRVKSEFISIASHELRTPISVIRGYQELMLEGTLGPVTPRQREALEATDRSVAALMRVAEDATRMAQIDDRHLALKRAPVEVATLVSEAVVKARASARGRRVAVEWEVSPDVATAHVDGPGMIQALGNLVGNGIRFTPDGGRVRVRADRDGAWLVVSVADDGVGIETDRQQHLFERSFSVRDSLNHHSSSTLEFNSAGLGLGLPIARGIVEAHGGQLTLESAPGRGATFTIRVPIGPGVAMERAA